MRILHLITRLILGGAQENTLLTVEGLHARGHEVHLATGPAIGPEGQLVDRARRGGFPLHIIHALRREINPFRDAAAYRDIRRIIRRIKPQIVHTHSSKAGILGRLAAHRLRVPVVVHTIHGLPFHPYQGPLTNFLFVDLERLAARWADGIITVADAMIDKAVAARVAPREKFFTIYSGMEVAPFLAASPSRDEAREELGIAAEEIVIGKIARLFELKGHDDVLAVAPDILRRFPRARFLFIGDGLWRERLRDRARNLGIAEKVVFHGLVPPDEVPGLIKAMDLLVHCSLREGLARVLPQALISGVPVVSYDVDGACEVVIPGDTGHLVPPQDTDALKSALLEALSDLPAAREMAAKARSLFTDRFRDSTMVDAIEGYYLKLAQAKGLPL